MKTYQDLLALGDDDTKRMDFVRSIIDGRNNNEDYKTALIAEDYDRRKNTTITNFQRILYEASGKAVPDNYSANYKMASGFFNRFAVQEAQYLLGNGISWQKPETAEVMGKDFDITLQKAGKLALVHRVAFCFWNFDHMEVFSRLEFEPLFDEINGSLSAGIRWWQIDVNKPMRATLYEIDGYTDYIWENGKGKILNKKKAYILNYKTSAVDGEVIYSGENYPSFPIVPLWANPHKQSELVGLREQIDCYDLIKSGFANTVDEASMIYWTLQNAGGMDEIDMRDFLDRLRKLHVAVADGATDATPHQIEAPWQSRGELLDRLRNDLYEDAMALDVKQISAGDTTATQIDASYEPLNEKVDQWEYCILDTLYEIMKLAGVEDSPSFTRSKINNTSEDITALLAGADRLPEDYVVQKLLNYLGDGDKAEEIIEQIHSDELGRLRA